MGPEVKMNTNKWSKPVRLLRGQERKQYLEDLARRREKMEVILEEREIEAEVEDEIIGDFASMLLNGKIKQER
jgi:hypothetical protein